MLLNHNEVLQTIKINALMLLNGKGVFLWNHLHCFFFFWNFGICGTKFLFPRCNTIISLFSFWLKVVKKFKIYLKNIELQKVRI